MALGRQFTGHSMDHWQEKAGNVVAHDLGMHRGQPYAPGCSKCDNDIYTHKSRKHERGNPDPNCTFCPPKRG